MSINENNYVASNSNSINVPCDAPFKDSKSIDPDSTFGLHINRIKKRKLKKGEAEYPTYEFKTIEEIFNVLTPKNMNRFFKDFKTGLSAMVHMREMTYLIAKENAKKDGVELDIDKQGIMIVPSFTWIDD